MKVMIVKEVMTGDVSPVAMFFWKSVNNTRAIIAILRQAKLPPLV